MSEQDIKEKLLYSARELIENIDLKDVREIDVNVDDRYEGEREICISIELKR